MDQSEEAAFTIVENLWKKSFDISKNADDPLFSLYTKSFETIMVYMTQSLDYEYIEKEIISLDKDRQLALQSENGYDAHRCLSFGIIEAVQIIMKKNTKKLEEMIKQGYIPVPEIPKFPLEPKEEEITEDPEQISAENEISSPSLPQEIIEQPNDDFAQDFPADDQASRLASIEQDFHLKEEEMMDEDVNTGMDNFAQEIDNPLNESPLEDEIMDEPDRTIPDGSDPIFKKNSRDNDEMMNDNDVTELNQPMKEERKSTRRVSRSVKYISMEDSDEEEVEPTIKKTRSDSAKKSVEDPSQVKCVLCEAYPKTAYGYANHLDRVHKSTLNANGIYLICSCGEEMRSRRIDYQNHHECLGFTLHKKEDQVHSTPKCILCETYPKTAHGYANHLKKLHKSTLKANRAYLRCSCGLEVRSDFHNRDHIGECDALRFSLHKIEDDIQTTPQCILCETFPKTTQGYANHIFRVHKSTLNSNGIHLLCSCGFRITSTKGSWKHSKECNEPQFSLHKNTEE